VPNYHEKQTNNKGWDGKDKRFIMSEDKRQKPTKQKKEPPNYFFFPSNHSYAYQNRGGDQVY